MRVAFDTNVLFHLEASASDPRHVLARDLYGQLLPNSIVLPAQVLGELFRILIRKAGLSREQAASILYSWHASHEIANTDADTVLMAVHLAVAHQLDIWDAVIIASAVSAGCRILLSEDMHNGFSWANLTVIDPFASPRHPLLDDLLAASSG